MTTYDNRPGCTCGRMWDAPDDRPRCECGAVLLPGFDPPGPHCRNCAPKHKRQAEMKR